MTDQDVEVTNLYSVKVIVEFNYDVEAQTKEEAEERGWYWEEYPQWGEVYSIDVELEEEDIYGEDDEE
jgi:hypothetical protein